MMYEQSSVRLVISSFVARTSCSIRSWSTTASASVYDDVSYFGSSRVYFSLFDSCDMYHHATATAKMIIQKSMVALIFLEKIISCKVVRDVFIDIQSEVSTQPGAHRFRSSPSAVGAARAISRREPTRDSA